MSFSSNSSVAKMIDGMKDVENLITFAKVAETAERYEDMAKAMHRVTTLKGSLDDNGRNLLSVAYKNVVGARRSAWRVISSLESKTDAQAERHLEIAKGFKANLEKELDATCNEVLGLLQDYLVKEECSSEATVFYLKMRGDYYRYIAEYKSEDDSGERAKAIENAEKAYTAALDHAEANMAPTHPNRLGLALNFSVFYYEILVSPNKACELAKRAFDLAIADLDNVRDECKDSTLIMQLLRDNLTLWTADQGGDDENVES